MSIKNNYQNARFGQNNKRKYKGADKMIADMAWNIFKKTGDINAYLEFKKAKNIEEKIKGSSNEANKG